MFFDFLPVLPAFSVTAAKKKIASLNQQLTLTMCSEGGLAGLECGRGDLMTIHCNGRVNVVTPGTPVPLSINPTVTASKLFFQAIPGLTGKTYIGIPQMVKATLGGVARVLSPNPTGGFSENFEIESQDGEDSIHLMDYAIDADVAGEGVLVTYFTE
jgi:hypothetical protein